MEKFTVISQDKKNNWKILSLLQKKDAYKENYFLVGINTLCIILTQMVYVMSVFFLYFLLNFKDINTEACFGALVLFVFVSGVFNSIDAYSNLEKSRNMYAKNFLSRNMERIKINTEHLPISFKNKKEILGQINFCSN